MHNRDTGHSSAIPPFSKTYKRWARFKNLFSQLQKPLDDACPSPWVKTNNHCYLLGFDACKDDGALEGNTQGCNWQESEDFCESKGGHLAELENMAELLTVQDMSVTGSEWWLGASDRYTIDIV